MTGDSSSSVTHQPRRSLARERTLYIGGGWRSPGAGEYYSKYNPMRPDEAIGRFAAADTADVEAAVAAAEAAFRDWRALPISRRASYIEQAAAILASRTDQIATGMTVEMGKPIREARAEVTRAASILRFAAGEATRPVGDSFQQQLGGGEISTHRRPLGVVALITPWNFPIAIPVWKLAPALIYGNTVVLKLAYEAPATGLEIAAAFADAGVPAGVLNVLTGHGSTAGTALVKTAAVRAISLTGSVETGKAVREQATALGKRVQLELGGHNPLIVMSDADLERAVEAAFVGAFSAAGQKCTASRRIYIQETSYDTFRQQLLERIARARLGDPLDPDVEIGPVVSEKQFDEVAAAIERGKTEATMICGGPVPYQDGYLIAPTVFEDVSDNAFLSCSEVFGPVTSLYRFANFDDAIERANNTSFGLSAAIFTSSLATATRFRHEAQAGLLHVNSPTTGADVHVPFGGIKASGWGPHEQGRAAIEFYTDQITVYVDP